MESKSLSDVRLTMDPPCLDSFAYPLAFTVEGGDLPGTYLIAFAEIDRLLQAVRANETRCSYCGEIVDHLRPASINDDCSHQLCDDCVDCFNRSPDASVEHLTDSSLIIFESA